MCSSGLMLLVSGVPAAIIVVPIITYQDLEWREIMILTAEFTLLVVLTGGVLYGLGLHFWERHRKAKTTSS